VELEVVSTGLMVYQFVLVLLVEDVGVVVAGSEVVVAAVVEGVL
jgi:hypothetical protein